MHTVASVRSLLDDRQALAAWFDRTRARSTALFRLIDEAAYYTRPITLRHPIVFYEGHLPAFAVNVLIKKGLGRPGVDERLERLFARGIDPHDQSAADASEARTRALWPSRSEVRAYVDAADRLLRDALLTETLVRDDVPVLRRGEAVFTVLEHEAMHQETLLYMWHRLPYALKAGAAPAGYSPWVSGRPPERTAVRVAAGTATLGAPRDRLAFGWDNEFDEHRVDVGAFDIDAHSVTNADWLRFMEDGGYTTEALWTPDDWAWIQTEGRRHPGFWLPQDDGYLWRAQFEEIALPLSWPVYVTLAEARAFAVWAGRELPTEAEWESFAQSADPMLGNQLDEAGAVMPRPPGDIFGDVWEWTQSAFAPYPGFAPAEGAVGEYNGKFMCSQFVLKGASCATPRGHSRASYRNFFPPDARWQFTGLRLARDS